VNEPLRRSLREVLHGNSFSSCKLENCVVVLSLLLINHIIQKARHLMKVLEDME